jgi:hypothetical protein
MNRSIYLLKSFEEAIGNLYEIGQVDGYKTATIGRVCVGIPEDVAAKLHAHIGKKVGLLRTDSDYRICVIPDHS